VVNVRDNKPLRGFRKIERRKVFWGEPSPRGAIGRLRKFPAPLNFLETAKSSYYLLFLKIDRERS
jgi:hypothetical protein